MSTNTSNDLLDDLIGVDASSSNLNDEVDEVENDTDEADEVDEENASDDEAENDENETTVETVSSVPEGAMSVTDFAAHMTQHMMRDKFQKGEDLDGSEYVQAQSVYQTVKAQRDKIPHVLVKTSDEPNAESRVYILTNEATEWWLTRRERLSTRGMGAKSASQRTPEDNLELLSGAVDKALYAKSRYNLWVERVKQADRLIEKYRGFLREAKVDEDQIAIAEQEGTDKFNADQAEKATKKAEKVAAKATTSNNKN